MSKAREKPRVVFNKFIDAKSNLIALQNCEDFWTDPIWIAEFQCPTDRARCLAAAPMFSRISIMT